MEKIIITTIITILIVAGCIYLINSIFKKSLKNQKQIHINFFKNLLKIIIILIAMIKIGNQFEAFKSVSTTILTSSSLLVVVLGFALQTSLEDFIAGILISLFKPFNIDDRIKLVKLDISGTIENITIRHTIIKTFTNNRLVIPNSIMNKEIIENSHSIDVRSGNFIDMTISYNSNIEKAKSIIKNTIEKHPNAINIEDSEKTEDYTQVYIRDCTENGIILRASVWTHDINTNFLTCSDIRETIIMEFNKNNIIIPCAQNEIKGTLNINQKRTN